MLTKNAGWLRESRLRSITLDADFSVKSVCGNQEGTEKRFNTTKKGAKFITRSCLFNFITSPSNLSCHFANFVWKQWMKRY